MVQPKYEPLIRTGELTIMATGLVQHIRDHGPPGYADAIMTAAIEVDEHFAYLARKHLNGIRAMYRPSLTDAERAELRSPDTPPERVAALRAKHRGYALPAKLPQPDPALFKAPQPRPMRAPRNVGTIGEHIAAPPQPPPKLAAPKRKGVGDHLHDVIREQMGVGVQAGCGCRAMLGQLNRWGPDGCRERIEEIVDHLMGQTDMLGGVKRAMLKVPGMKSLARVKARAMVVEAIGRANGGDCK